VCGKKKRKKRQRTHAMPKSRHAQMGLFDEGPIWEDFFTTDFTQKSEKTMFTWFHPLVEKMTFAL
jgi:hypothetical protein